MKRRTFMESFAAGALALVVRGPRVALGANVSGEDDLEAAFRSLPASARPKTWWHWMNGNITRDGITRDLEALHRAGVGGFQIFQVGTGIPKGPVNYGSDEWLHLLQHAAAEADRLGLEYDMMNCPGWSSSGGPWITPELSMQQLTWSETQVSGGSEVDVHLPEPFKKRNYYRDALVLAFPSIDGEETPLKELLSRVTSNSGEVDGTLLTGGDPTKGVDIAPAGGQAAYILLEFKEPYGARSVEFYPNAPADAGYSFRYPAMSLEASDDGSSFRKIYDLGVPRRRGPIEVPAVANFPLTKAKYFRLVASGPGSIARLRISGSVRIIDWPLKANFAHRDGAEPFPATGAVPKGSVIDPASVLDVSRYMDSSGRLKWQAPAGNWTILRMGQTTTGVENHPAPDGGLGLECDKYSKTAYDYHFDHFFGKLLPTLESLGAKGQAGAVIDSYEVGMQTWTEEFPHEFQNRRGYDLRKYMPAMTGRVVRSGEISDRFLWDVRRTCADLMDNYYYGRFAELCREHGMKAYAEPYSGGPFEEMEAGSKLDIPMGEFWVARGNHYSIKLASCIGHIYGKPIVGAESYTGFPTCAKWQEFPYAMKGQGDWMFTQGLNEFVFHVYAMQPHPTAKPGMTMGPWGWMHSRTNTWFGSESSWLEYANRCHHLLRQGVTVADLVYFAGVDVPVDTPVWPDQLNPTPPLGYYYDVTDAGGILNRMKVQNGWIFLPDGMNYRVLVLPEEQMLTLELLRKVRDLVRGGATVVGPKPRQAPGLSGYPGSDEELSRLAEEVWGDLDGTSSTERSFGKGRVFWEKSMTNVLDKLGITPDFDFTSRSGDAPINYIHRRTGDTDIYFVANRRRLPEELVCTFRVENRKPEIWDPETGEITPAEIYDLVDGGVRLPLRMEKAGSVFVVFRSPAEGHRLREISRGGLTLAGTKPFPALASGRYRGVKNNFTISVWVKPEIDLGLPPEGVRVDASSFSRPESFVVYPPDGAVVYGPGNAACGLTAGRDGVIVYERSNGKISAVILTRRHLSGWTHLAVVYDAGVPTLYVDGNLVEHGRKSGNIVHPGLGEAFERDGAAYFHGEMGKPELFKQVLGEDRVRQLAAVHSRPVEEPPAVELAGNGKPELLIWQNGDYILQPHAGAASSVHVSAIEPPRTISGPWHVSFPPNLGAPVEITLPELISLHKHAESGVRYFSGTATYRKRFSADRGETDGKRIFLDLGEVEIFAEVHLNGRNMGVLWRPPYRVDVTEALHSAENELEVLVTNLWPNRLIGDEQLPAENEYEETSSVFGGAIKKLPDWYLDGKAKPPGGRITFTTWKHFDKDSPLLESGLVGPVRLLTAVRHRLA